MVHCLLHTSRWLFTSAADNRDKIKEPHERNTGLGRREMDKERIEERGREERKSRGERGRGEDIVGRERRERGIRGKGDSDWVVFLPLRDCC